MDISSFSVTLDNSSFGNLFATSIDFVNGTTTQLTQNIDQTLSGLVVNVGAVTGVRSIILPTTAFYDNLTINFTASASSRCATHQNPLFERENNAMLLL